MRSSDPFTTEEKEARQYFRLLFGTIGEPVYRLPQLAMACSSRFLKSTATSLLTPASCMVTP